MSSPDLCTTSTMHVPGHLRNNALCFVCHSSVF